MGLNLYLSHHPAQAAQAQALADRLRQTDHTLSPSPAGADRLLLFLSQQWMDEVWPDLAPSFATPGERARLLPILAQPCALTPWLARMRPVDLVHRPDTAFAQILARLTTQQTAYFDAIWQVGGDDPKRVRTLDRHAAFVTGVALLDDGRQAVSASADGSLIVWDLADARPLTALTGHTGAVNAVAAAHSHIFSAGSDGTLRRWSPGDTGARETTDWQNDRTWDFPATVHTLVCAGDGRFLIAAAQDAGLTVLDLAKDRLLFHDHIHTDWVRTVALFPDGWAISSGDDRGLALWEPLTGRVISRRAEAGGQAGGFISALAALPPGGDGHRRVLAGGDDRTLAIWDVDTGRVLHTVTRHAASVRSVAVTPDGRTALSAGNDGDLLLWTLPPDAAPILAATLTGHIGAVNQAQILPDGGHALSASTDTTLRLWTLDPVILAQPATAPGHDGEVTALALSPDADRLASAGEDCTVRLWDTATGAPLGRMESRFPVLGLAFTPDGHKLLTVDEGGRMEIHALPLTPDHPPLARREGRGSLLCAAVSPDGRWAAAGSVNWAVILWDLETFSHRVLSGHRAGITALAFLPDGRLLSGDEDGVLMIWGGETGDSLRRLAVGEAAITGILPLAEGRILLADESPTPRILDLDTGRTLAHFPGPADWITALGPLAHGQLLAAASDDSTLRAWDLPSAQEIARLALAHPPAALVTDPVSRTLFLGDVAGRLYRFEAGG